jgi:cobalt-zinc-cadmium resistance protein CzcA
LLKARHRELINSRQKLKALLDYYNGNGRALHNEMIRTATLSFQKGEIDFIRFATSTELALQIELDYLSNLMDYNLITLELNYFSK